MARLIRFLPSLALLAALSFLAACGAKRSVKAVTPSIGAAQKGIASWYGYPYHGRRAASGEIYDMEQFTAAHRNWAFGTWVRVYNLDNGSVTDVRINDRGPFVRGRIIDLSRAAARSINMLGPGTAKVRLVVIPPPLDTATAPPPQPTSAPPVVQPPPAVPSAPPAAAPLSRYWTVQVATFSSRARADALRARLEPRFAPVRVLESRGLWRVVAGQFPDAASAASTRAQLRTEFADAFVVQIEDGR